MKKEFKITVNVEEEDFCFIDLKECLLSGSGLVGNHTLYNVFEVEE